MALAERPDRDRRARRATWRPFPQGLGHLLGERCWGHWAPHAAGPRLTPDAEISSMQSEGRCQSWTARLSGGKRGGSGPGDGLLDAAAEARATGEDTRVGAHGVPSLRAAKGAIDSAGASQGRGPLQTTRLQRSCSQDNELAEFNGKRHPVFRRAKDLIRTSQRRHKRPRTHTRLNVTHHQGMRTKPVRSHPHQHGRCKQLTRPKTKPGNSRCQHVETLDSRHRCRESNGVRLPRKRPGSSSRPGFTGGREQGRGQTA